MVILGWIYLKAGVSQAVRLGFCPGHQGFWAGREIYKAHRLQPEMRGPLFDLCLVTKGTF